MKTIKNFIDDSIDLKSNLTIGGYVDSGCYETDYKTTFGGPGDDWNYDDSVTFYDDNNNEVGWELDRW